jgi:methionyl-tRNA formyltransferase
MLSRRIAAIVSPNRDRRKWNVPFDRVYLCSVSDLPMLGSAARWERPMALRIAIFGQARFGREVSERLADAGHQVVGVYAPPEGARPDPLAALAGERGWKLFRHERFRRGGCALPELLDEYRGLDAELNVMPFTTVILPSEIVDHPKHGSLCFHPSLLPAFRGGAALAWQIILGAKESGVTVFRAGRGVDDGPIAVQKRGVTISRSDTTASLYFDKLYPLGVEAMVEAVDGVADGTVRFTAQAESAASFHGLVTDDIARIDWSRPADEIDRLIRGCTPGPGAIASHGGEILRLFGSRMFEGCSDRPAGTVLDTDGDELVIATGRGCIAIAKIQRGEGEKRTAAEGIERNVRLD